MIVVRKNVYVPGDPMRTAEWVHLVSLDGGIIHRGDPNYRFRTHCGIDWFGLLSASWFDPIEKVTCQACLDTPGRAPRVPRAG